MKGYGAAYAAANHAHVVDYHDWYWKRLGWEVRLLLNALKLETGPKGNLLLRSRIGQGQTWSGPKNGSTARSVR